MDGIAFLGARAWAFLGWLQGEFNADVATPFNVASEGVKLLGHPVRFPD